jgi:hypothetical protein
LAENLSQHFYGIQRTEIVIVKKPEWSKIDISIRVIVL